jgi:hypothetical protein
MMRLMAERQSKWKPYKAGQAIRSKRSEVLLNNRFRMLVLLSLLHGPGWRPFGEDRSGNPLYRNAKCCNFHIFKLLRCCGLFLERAPLNEPYPLTKEGVRHGVACPGTCLLWVISGHLSADLGCLFYPTKRTCSASALMSAKCH